MDDVMFQLKKRILIRLVMFPIFLWVFILLPAGSFKLWEVWTYFIVILIPMLFVLKFFLIRSPELLERRLKLKENEKNQKIIILISTLLFLVGFIISGLDHRFNWSDINKYIVIVADIVVFSGYMIVFFALKENEYASHIIEVTKGQKVISTGPYSVVRHPMYSGAILMFLSTPIALGSLLAMAPFVLLAASIVFRMLAEEKYLSQKLTGYKKYCKKVRYRLIPFIW